MQKFANLVDLVKSFPTSIYYLLANFGFDTAENELSKVCPIPRGAARSAVGLSFAVAAAAGSRRDARVPDAFEPISREEVDY